MFNPYNDENDDSFRKRLYFVLKEKGGPFWESVGVYKSAAMHGVITKNTMPGGLKLLEICKIGNISPLWLFFGEGPKEKLDVLNLLEKKIASPNFDKIDIPSISEKIRVLASELPSIISSGTDIEEQEKILQNLTILEALIPAIKKKMELYYHHKNEFFLMFNRHGKLVSVNDLFLQRTGLKKEDIINSVFFIPVHPEDKNKMFEGIEKIFLGISFHEEAKIRVRLNDGSYEYQKWVSFARLSPSGEYLGRQSVGKGISEEKG